MSIKYPSSSPLIDFSLKSILLDFRIAIPACFLGPFKLENLFPVFYSEVMSVIEIKMCFIWKNEKPRIAKTTLYNKQLPESSPP